MSYGSELSGKRRHSPYVRAAGRPEMAQEVAEEAGGGAQKGTTAPGELENGARRPTRRQSDTELARKALDPNRYATKKTIAQGMLDVALLTANASQLRYVLQVGEKHEFYTLMVTLISFSIILQVLIGVLSLSLNLLRDCRLEREEFARSANAINFSSMAMVFVITTTNVMISAFDVRPVPGSDSGVQIVATPQG